MRQIVYEKSFKRKPVPKGNPFINLFNEIKVNYSLFILLLPGLFLVIVLSYLPMSGILIAFQKYEFLSKNFFINIIKCKWVWFDNFWFFSNTYFVSALKNTVFYNLLFYTTGLFFSLSIAIIINEITNRKMAKLYHSCMLLPYFLSWVVFSYVVFAFLGLEHGFLNNTIFPILGIQEISFYSDNKYWPCILFIVNTMKYATYGSILYLSAIVGLDPEYFELARIYGANKWQQITKITIPLISDVIIIMLILNLGNILSADFGLFYNIPLQSQLLRDGTDILDTYIYRMITTSSLGVPAAAGLIKSVVGMLTVLLANFLVRKIDKEKALF